MFKGELGVIRRYFRRRHIAVVEVHVAGTASEPAEASPEISVCMISRLGSPSRGQRNGTKRQVIGYGRDPQSRNNDG